MSEVPVSTLLHNAIEPKIQFPEKERRGYLGLSGLNNECPAKVWFTFRWASPPEKINAKRKRIFERGDLEESRIIRELSSVGIEFFRRDKDGNKVPITGHPDEEQEEVIGFAGHSAGHPDGRVIGVPLFEEEEMLFEAKTMSRSSFSKYKKLPLEKYNRVYYGQVQSYMGKLGLKRTFYVCINKDNEERHYDIIEFDPSYYEDLCRREEFLIQNEEKLPPAYKKGFWKCDFCPHILPCHFDQPPEKNCRTCANVVLCDNGKWECGLDGRELSKQDQIRGCEYYKRLF